MNAVLKKSIRYFAIALIASPVVALIFSDPLIRFLAPDDPVPQGAMGVAFLLILFSLIILVPSGFILLYLVKKKGQRAEFLANHRLSKEEMAEMKVFLSQDKGLKFLEIEDRILRFREWKENRP